MILQLPFFLDASSDECITFEIMALVKKNLLNPVKNYRENYIFNWSNNFLNSIRK